MVVHTPNLRRQRGEWISFEFQSQNGLHGEFEDGQECREKLCLKQPEECREKTKKEE